MANSPTQERIAKRIAAAGICSRRDAERLIDEGRVMLNGKTVTTPATLVSEDDAVKVDGTLLKQAATLPRLWLYHKPKGLLTTHRDPGGRPTVFEYLPAHLPRVISVGRLDLNTEGLLLLTTSGALARAMELPTNAMQRTYRVRVDGTMSNGAVDLLERGVTIEGVRYKPAGISRDRNNPSSRNQWLTITLAEGKNREIRKLCEYVDLRVSRLIRTAYGPFALGDMAQESIKPVADAQVKALCDQLKVAYSAKKQ